MGVKLTDETTWPRPHRTDPVRCAKQESLQYSHECVTLMKEAAKLSVLRGVAETQVL